VTVTSRLKTQICFAYVGRPYRLVQRWAALQFMFTAMFQNQLPLEIPHPRLKIPSRAWSIIQLRLVPFPRHDT
jgi:hypothetical protein